MAVVQRREIPIVHQTDQQSSVEQNSAAKAKAAQPAGEQKIEAKRKVRAAERRIARAERRASERKRQEALAAVRHPKEPENALTSALGPAPVASSLPLQDN